MAGRLMKVFRVNFFRFPSRFCLGKHFNRFCQWRELLDHTQHLQIRSLVCARTLCSSAQTRPEQDSKPSTSCDDSTSDIGVPDEEETRPHMLNVVWRVHSTMRRPYWEAYIIKQLKLERSFYPVVHKNTPSVNSLLRRVRHLVRIKPLVLKNGLPNGDYDSTLLKWNGDFVVRRKLDNVGKEITAGEETNDSQERSASDNDDVTGEKSR